MNQQDILVSIVIPYYKSHDTIERAIQSVFYQTTKNFEVIIVDDFSNQKIDIDILEKLSLRDKVNVIFLDKNMGPGGARNAGILKARGEFIAFLDSDDAWKPNKLEIQIDIMKKYNAFISGHHSAIEGQIEKDSNNIKMISKTKQLMKNYFPTRSVIIRNQNQYKFLDTKRYAEDYLLWTKIVMDGNKAIYIEKTLANSYKDDYGAAGLTSNLKNMHDGVIETFEILYQENKIKRFEYILLKRMENTKYLRRFLIKTIRDNKQ